MKLKVLLVVALLVAPVSLFMSTKESVITGVVTAKSDDLALPGVDVKVKGTDITTQTDFDGNYEIKASKGDVLVFSYIKMTTQEIKVGSKKNINVKLE